VDVLTVEAADILSWPSTSRVDVSWAMLLLCCVQKSTKQYSKAAKINI